MEESKRNVTICRDVDGRSVVVIHDIRFKGKRSVDWKDVKEYLKQYVGDVYTIVDTNDIVYIGSDLPSEYAGSEYTRSLKGAVAKAKANAVQGIPELLSAATGMSYVENRKKKHIIDGAFGWYRYDARFALPVYDNKGEVERYNIFHAHLIIRHDLNGKKFLYDAVNIKKETSNPHRYKD